MMTVRWLAGLLGLVACAQLSARARKSDVAPILAAASESVFVRALPPMSNGVLLASDSATARALAGPARRQGFLIRVAREPVWCRGDTGMARTEGTKVTIALDSITADRAVVQWSVLCSLESATHSTPFAGGSGGSLELARQGRAWHVVGAPTTFAY
jgi:hypothetical protein